MAHSTVLILDFGSQYTQLIARSIRSLNIYCEIHPYNISDEQIRSLAPKAIILSGSPASLTQDNPPLPGSLIWQLGLPILGICFGMQLVVDHFKGAVASADHKEYGYAELEILDKSKLFKGMKDIEQVWMSHGDSISGINDAMQILGKTRNSAYAALKAKDQDIYAIQFHPEVVNSPCGDLLFRNFLVEIAGISPDWTPASFIEETISSIRKQVGTDEVILGLSGGVDSSVAAALLYKAIGDQLIPIFVDNGLMRYKEAERVREFFAKVPGFNIRFVDASELFLSKLAGISDPEQKRKIIGATFVEVFEQEARKYNNAKWLAQGTLYPDVIESVSFKGPSATIKSHHNVGGLPEKMHLKLVEPLRELFKDEVRLVGEKLGLPHHLVHRHPFPGPGLGVRILGEITAQKVTLLQKVDEVFISELVSSGLYYSTWQAFAVLLPVRTVGVMGDERSYDYVCALRAVNSVDGMTADWTELPFDFLKRVSSRISNEVKGINRVVYDISSKPPSTIEWE
ncbi:MAG: GMP synthase (glutamine-hydrolyzing) [Candidatus Cloacimonetes bacterium HGW-Cloacimonetes-2]|jgi:GMP synthase (glutamine-hydrolysing)|nr:MAG: GMP synthase (glutamine-hydrolyzing) [Candidatus Cloacimonetes bacterium HGW-Cloacimonetes-2]